MTFPGDEDENEDGEPEGEGWELDPNDPSHPDFDLSESAYSGVESGGESHLLSRGFVILMSILLLIAFLGPLCLNIYRFH